MEIAIGYARCEQSATILQKAHLRYELDEAGVSLGDVAACLERALVHDLETHGVRETAMEEV